MYLLAFETSAKAASTALLQDGKLLAESYQNTGLTHSQTLLSMAEEMLKTAGVTAVDAVAVAEGPGSFTGVRIGVAAAKGYAWGGEIPCYGVSTLEAMAVSLNAYQGYVLPVMDARRGQVYTALFHCDAGVLSREMEDCAISLEEVKEKIKKLQEPVFLVGDGSILCYNALVEHVPGLVLPAEHRMHQRASGVGVVAYRQHLTGAKGDGAALKPNYLRLSQAERERLAKQNKQ